MYQTDRYTDKCFKRDFDAIKWAGKGELSENGRKIQNEYRRKYSQYNI